MDFADNHYYKLNRQLLLLIGQWPYQNRKTKLMCGLFIILLLTSFITIGVIKFCTSVLSMDLFASLLPFGSFIVILYSKYIFSLIHGKRMKDLFDGVKDDWNILRGKNECEAMRECAEEGRTYVVRYVLYNAVLAVFFCLLTLTLPIFNIIVPSNVSRSFRFPLAAGYILNEEQYLVPIMLHFYVVCSVGLCIAMAIDGTIISLVHHVNGLFKVAGYQLEHALDDFRQEKIHSQIMSCVDSHMKAKKYVAVLNVCHQWMYFLNVILSIVSMTFSLYHTTTYVSEWNEFIMAISFACTQIIYILIIMYPMQKLKDQSSMMFEKAYNARWYAAPTSGKKSLLLIMTICEHPSFLVVGGVFNVTLESYTKVVHATLSCVTVLCSIK